MFNRGGVAGPLLAHMLDKLAVPGFEGVAALSPIEHKLRHGIRNKLRIDTGAGKNLTGVLIGLPVMSNGTGFFLTRTKSRAFMTGCGLSGLSRAIK